MDEGSQLNPQFAEQARNPSLRTDAVYAAVREMVVSGRARPGQRLRQQALAQALNVDQRTVREALSRLVSEGLLQREPYKGVRAVLLPVPELMDVYRMRALLEPLAMEAAAGRITPEETARMRALLPRASGSPLEEAESGVPHREFHWIAIRASQRWQVIRILEHLWNVISTHAWLQAPTDEQRMRDSRVNLDLHMRLVEALEARDSKRAAEIGAEHVLHTLAGLPSRLRSAGDP